MKRQRYISILIDENVVEKQLYFICCCSKTLRFANFAFMECILLAGGLGTRLQGVIGHNPKCMAMVAGKPFLHYLFDYLASQQCQHVILSLGFRSEIVEAWLAGKKHTFRITVVKEPTPLGTGGAIRLALNAAATQAVVVMNGDTYFPVDLAALMQHHQANQATATLALKSMTHFDRYGVVALNAQGQITGFAEKQYREAGLINGGVYVVNRDFFSGLSLPENFSFENDYLEPAASCEKLMGFVSDAPFIDIGIPEDLLKAQDILRMKDV